MRSLLMGAAALALLTACGGGDKPKASAEDVTAALTEMALDTSENGKVQFGSSDVKGGKAVFKNFSALIDEGDDVRLTAETLTLDGLHMTDAGGNFSSMTFDNLKLADPDGEGVLTISSLVVEDPTPAVGAWIAELMETGDPGDFPSMEEAGFSEFSINGFSFKGGEDDPDDMQASISMGGLSFNDLANGSLGKFALKSLDFSVVDPFGGTNATGKLGLVEMAGLSPTQTQAFFAGMNGDDPSKLLEIVQANPLDPGYETAVIEGLDMDINGIAVKATPIRAAVDYNKDGKPVSAETKEFTITMTPDASGQFGSQIAPFMGQMGLETLEITSAGKSKFDVAGDRVTGSASDNYLKIKDVAELSYGIDAGGIAAYQEAAVGAVASENPMAILGALTSLEINGLEIGLDDNGLVEKALALSATMSGQDPAELRQQVLDQVGFLPLAAGSMGIDAVMAEELAGALRTFIESPGKLTLKLDPAETITGDVFANPAALTKDRLGFSATTE